jgi:hypothetical protein
MNYKLVFIAILLVIGSCKEQRKEIAKPISDIDSLTISQTDTTSNVKMVRFQFDTTYFKQQVDSLFTYINHQHKGTRLRVDTFKYNRHYWFYPFLDSAQYTLRYRFIPKPENSLTFEVYEAHYTNQAISNDRFSKTFQEGVDTLGMPGLSYAYDFVIKKDDVIVALAVPCTFSDRNYRALLSYFKDSFHSVIPTDTLTCRCGDRCK